MSLEGMRHALAEGAEVREPKGERLPQHVCVGPGPCPHAACRKNQEVGPEPSPTWDHRWPSPEEEERAWREEQGEAEGG